MRTVISVLFVLFLISFPLTVFAEEGPMELPEGSNASADMHNKMGIKNWEAGTVEEACRHFREATAADGAIAETHFNEGVCLNKIGDHGAATVHFRTAKEYANGNKAILDSPILKGHVR